ncbi:MAG: hypothetical protein JOY78_08510 [Pseudonocardia sp.]|nr:hypothetical protein [Pseudonocardia sp.]
MSEGTCVIPDTVPLGTPPRGAQAGAVTGYAERRALYDAAALATRAVHPGQCPEDHGGALAVPCTSPRRSWAIGLQVSRTIHTARPCART